jgi:hypothetical protein
MVVSESHHAGANQGRAGEPGDDYERAVAQAAELVLAHLKACPDDVHLSRDRHEEGATLYAAAVATFPELGGMRLTSLMWDQAAGRAVAAFLAATEEETGD